jgi:EAL domain-containing protein (putative c-di-GMP-specific phosphodiesterase class I)
MRAVAEGVESARHQELLTAMGCGFGQGFHFGRPGPAEDLPIPQTG